MCLIDVMEYLRGWREAVEWVEVRGGRRGVRVDAISITGSGAGSSGWEEVFEM